MSEASETNQEFPGALLAGGAYAIWGVVPLYWDLLGAVPPFEITLHRIAWCALTALLVTLARGRLTYLAAIFRSWRLIGALALSSLLISVNWTIYIYCVTSHQLVDASLGYYLTPLVSIALGVTLLGEKISRLRIAAIGLATTAVAVQAVALGHVPWVAPALALTFGFYGYVRKLTPVDALDGLTIETLLLAPAAVGLLVFWAMAGTAAFPSAIAMRDLLLIATGPLTAIPLVMFAAGARLVRMTTLGFLQYLSPSITLVIATLILHEPFTRTNAIAFGCVWAALILVSVDGRLGFLARRPA
jgi:chloramphenicol-sensitive protein RarD